MSQLSAPPTLPFEDWESGLHERYHKLKNTIESKMPGGGKDFACSLEEFKGCKFEELVLRRRMGFNAAGYSINFSFSDLDPAKRFELEQSKK